MRTVRVAPFYLIDSIASADDSKVSHIEAGVDQLSYDTFDGVVIIKCHTHNIVGCHAISHPGVCCTARRANLLDSSCNYRCVDNMPVLAIGCPRTCNQRKPFPGHRLPACGAQAGAEEREGCLSSIKQLP
jgi:hypothetical protein